ncbi:unnamed protein product [Caenorhabditis nigoni]
MLDTKQSNQETNWWHLVGGTTAVGFEEMILNMSSVGGRIRRGEEHHKELEKCGKFGIFPYTTSFIAIKPDSRGPDDPLA